jgi:hypothetical protein
MECWKTGMLENWVLKAEFTLFLLLSKKPIFFRETYAWETHHSIIPGFHYSNGAKSLVL